MRPSTSRTNSFDAEQGAAGGAAINVAIKSGTNQYHGVAFERNQNNEMTAVNYFSHTSPLNKNIFNQYGFAFGGPVWIPKLVHGKNKFFFFLDYQGTKRRQYAASTNLTLPTAAMRTGDLSATGVTIYDPLTGNADGTGRTPFANNTIPTTRIDPAAATLTGLLPTLTRPNSYTSNYDAYGNTQYNRDNWDFKVNYNPTDKLMVWGRYSLSPMDIVALLVLGPIAGGDAFGGGNPGHAGGRVQTTAAGFTYTISPTVLVDGNVGYTRQNIGANGDEQNGDYGTDVLKIPGTNGVGPNYMGVPGFQVTGVANMGNTNTGSPFQFRDNQYTTAINLSKTKGAHNLRFGFEYDKYALNHFQPQGGTFGTARGTFGFDGTLTALKGGAAVNFNGVPANSWAQFLLGDPSRVGKITQFQNPNSLRFSDWAFYARDQWQVTRNLTINYGLRWEYYPIFSHNWYGATRFDTATLTESDWRRRQRSLGHRRNRQQEGFCSAPWPGLSPRPQDGDPHRLRHYHRSGQHAQPAQCIPLGAQPGLPAGELLPVRHQYGRSHSHAAHRHSRAHRPGYQRRQDHRVHRCLSHHVSAKHQHCRLVPPVHEPGLHSELELLRPA